MNNFTINIVKGQVWSLVTLYILVSVDVGPIGKYFKSHSSISWADTPWNYLNLQIILSPVQIHLTVVSHLLLILLHTNSISDSRNVLNIIKQIYWAIKIQIYRVLVCGYHINNINICFCHIIGVDRITEINIMQIRNRMITIVEIV